MNKLEMRGVEGNASDQRLGIFRRVVFPVADDRVADRRKLSPDLILQSRHQRHPDESGAAKKPLDGIPKFGPGGSGVRLFSQSLKHPYALKVVNQSRLLGLQAPADNRQIIPLRLMVEKLPHERLAIGRGLGEEQDAGRETVDAMDDQGPLPPRLQSGGKQHQGGRNIETFDGHGG